MALNRGCSYREQIGPSSAGRSVVAHLAASYRHSTVEDWWARLRRHEVEIDGATAAGGEGLRAGQWLVWHRPPWDEPDVPTHFAVVYEDHDLLAVSKPAGLPTMPAGGFLEHTLLALVRAARGDVHPLHRLGRHTSGLVLFARTPSSAARLGRAWRNREVVKDYRALASGVPAWSHLEIAAGIGPVAHPVLGTVFASSATGKASHSEVTVRERRNGETLCDVRIATGRPHQIRIHLAWAGHPLVGDPLYVPGGVPKPANPGLPGDGGYLLHAHRLRCPHPRRNVVLELEAPPPPPLCDGR